MATYQNARECFVSSLCNWGTNTIVITVLHSTSICIQPFLVETNFSLSGYTVSVLFYSNGQWKSLFSPFDVSLYTSPPFWRNTNLFYIKMLQIRAHESAAMPLLNIHCQVLWSFLAWMYGFEPRRKWDIRIHCCVLATVLCMLWSLCMYTYVCAYVFTYVCIYVCMYICMYVVRRYACLYVYM
jgi:hypothetical protein